jgi:hypothetical protein
MRSRCGEGMRFRRRLTLPSQRRESRAPVDSQGTEPYGVSLAAGGTGTSHSSSAPSRSILAALS